MSKKPLLQNHSSKSTALFVPKAKSSRVSAHHSLNWSKKSLQVIKPSKCLPSTLPPSTMSPIYPETILKDSIFLVSKKPFNKDAPFKPTQNSGKEIKSFKSTRIISGSLETSIKPKPRILVNNKYFNNSKTIKQKIVKVQHSSSQSLPQQPILIGNLLKIENKTYLHPILPSISARSSVQKKKTCVSAKIIDESSEFSNLIELSSESEDSDTEKSNISTLASSILETFIEISIGNYLKNIATEAQNQVILAYLSLFSSKVLYKIIEQVLDSCTPKIVQLAYVEESEAEYTGICDQIFTEFYEQQVNSLIDDFNLTQISLEIMKDYAKLLPIQEIVKECVNEEIQWKNDIINGIYEELIDLVMDKESTELLVEDEIGKIKIEEIWKNFPKNLMKDFKEIKKRGIFDRLAEFVWFDYLNEDLACEWVKELVEEVWADEVGGKVIDGCYED